MNPPFKRPVRIEGGWLLAADGALILNVDAASDDERDFIVEAVNGYLPQLVGKQRKFGRNQLKALAMLKQVRYWHKHCTWPGHWPPPSSMAIIMETLLERGLVIKTSFPSQDAPGTEIARYDITYEGEQCDTD